MRFKKVDCEEEINKVKSEDPEAGKYVEEYEIIYDIIQSIIEKRKKLGLTQKDLAKKSGLTQQMISRIEKIDNTPTLNNFLRYINSIGLELKIISK